MAAGQDIFIVVLHDGSERQRIEGMLEERVAELAATLESTADGILVTDVAGNIRSFNQAFAALWTCPTWSCAAATTMRSSPPCDVPSSTRRPTCAALPPPTTSSFSRPSTQWRCCRPRAATRDAAAGQPWPCHRPGAFVPRHRRAAGRIQRIETLSHSDVLTGLPDRSVLADRVEFSIAMSQREGTPFALLVANLDRFKHVNETLGMSSPIGAGRRGRSPQACLRQVDTVTRLGGDES